MKLRLSEKKYIMQGTGIKKGCQVLAHLNSLQLNITQRNFGE
jgi:hypothetical protein